ncbi:uncharacterized protein K452DRAFT_287592 [Aplosporella prunicola CBS 121167]|uniref:Uncharacterized protein n=1 Tax=Aplosporella prunicola CBS 121167 TaxID=1176127 RepID=A0A6A6BBN1_9PEZI|nr:uncharacterized protein K452DRAFT_287592 [Aplosporella prunicola CBS 121167]KAF2141642.1 hypothetical protein K452DRAFT_287592 [Aplosporella prunicola CBS 121167]
MIASPRRLLPLLALTTVAFFFYLYYATNVQESWRGLPQAIGLGESTVEAQDNGTAADADELGEDEDDMESISVPTAWSARPDFRPGVGLPLGQNATTVLVIPRTHDEDVSWIEKHLPEVETAVYVADDPRAKLHPPKNKGHEVMVYLSWIIDNYEKLPDVALFMHSHRLAWHNNDALDLDAVEMVRRLNRNRVLREGYMNLRCHWTPGCPDWMHPGEIEDDATKREQKLLAKAWSELFPLDPIPDVLAQPCCSQFALSRDRIRSIPVQRFTAYRDWLLRSPLDDALSGRIWEYMWQFVFAGANVLCPIQHVCYCDGYGVCFGNDELYNMWIDQRMQLRDLELELNGWHEQQRAVHAAMQGGQIDELADLQVPEVGRDIFLGREIEKLRFVLRQKLEDAVQRGKDPRIRAEDCGREWHEGDGF